MEFADEAVGVDELIGGRLEKVEVEVPKECKQYECYVITTTFKSPSQN